EDEIDPLAVVRTRLVRLQLMEKVGGEVDRSAAGVRLAVFHAQNAAGKVDRAPLQLAELADAKPAEEHRREQCSVLLGGVENRPYLVELKPRPPRLCRLEPAPLAARRVGAQVAIFDAVVQHRRGNAKRAVDAAVRE